MTGSFNGQILIDKLSKLNCSQQSIETLSHWCIFHRKNAKQVVETWVSQFHCSPREQRVSFLYLANDILQNSRRKGSEFVVEFWRVLPDALNDVLENGNDSDKRAALRLVGIWEERKVFGSRGHVLKEELLGRNVENIKTIEKNANDKLKSYIGDVLEKIISRYKHVYESSLDEEAIMGKCQSAFSCIEKLEKDSRNPQSGANGGEVHGDLEGSCATLRQCVEQLKATELSRTLLISHLREAVRDEELKMEQLRNHLQVAEGHLEVACNIHEQLNRSNGKLTPEKRAQEINQIADQNPTAAPDPAERTGDRERTAPVMYTQQCNFPDNPTQSEDEHRKSTAAAVAARLAASTSSAEMLSYVLSSLASEGVIGQQTKEDHSSGDNNKKPKLDNGTVSYTPTTPMQQVSLPFPPPDSLHQTSQSLHQQPSASVPPQGIPLQPLPQPQSLPPLQPPLHPNQFMQNAGAVPNMSYNYGSGPLQRPPQLSVYQSSNMPPYPVHPGTYQNGQQMESGGFNQPPLPGTLPPFSRQ